MRIDSARPEEVATALARTHPLERIALATRTHRCRIALLVLWAACGSAQAAEEPALCATLSDDRERLACYDRTFRAQPAAVPAPASPVNQPSRLPLAAVAATAPSQPEQQRIRREHIGSSLGERWELDPGSSLGTFLPRPYKPMYVLPVVVTNRLNRQPTSGSAVNSVSQPVTLDDMEAKFQFSLMTKLWETVLDSPGSLWMGYTQSSRWQVYNAGLSRPFRETNYEPELMFIWPTDYSLFGWRGRLLGLSLNHQSNGRSLPLSRSWNRVIAQAAFERDDWTLVLRPWWRVKESEAVDDNPDIQNYIGRGELLLTRKLQRHTLALQLRSSLRSQPAGGSVQFDWAFPIWGTLNGYFQLFHGYGESMIDFNFRQTRAGIGVSLVEWR